ncbi:CBM35 domain-containing protein [Paenibacillus sp. KACC 21273]|uniref:carbohydrate-binding protein n=1 Tax=Paenibacillus sp. KACC 21273 TaxID=3025665 RepID=UPI002366CEA8|nr:CBM35 domain-containing protein [Paenibacillus sp. KACC 21273]WDF52513.1 CBM35 domain-containing protein [Paenibacillus sp. KACC 21273]
MRSRKWSSVLVVTTVLVSIWGGSGSAKAASPQIVVDLASNTGSIKYGASGFLYGLGSDGVPSSTMLAPLNPQAIAQKAPDGAQHPNGDALKVAPEFIKAGGKEIQIYMQDIYENWPYENLGLQDYLKKIDVMVPKVVADPNHSKFVYVPFNEPDGIWYQGINNYNNASGQEARNKFFADWKTVYNHIRSLDSQAKIAGPNLAAYHAQFYDDFFTYAKNNNVLPDVTTWHELGNDFFTDWYNHYNHYRNVEKKLGISARPIAINEYARISGDLGVPGNLIQWMTRLENSKVDGMLAYWTAAGTLNDLVTENNKPTGGWWLYKWYGQLTGHTVTVTPPTTNGSLQALAALDPDKKQARILFGGSVNPSDVYSTDVVIKGLDTASYMSKNVHVSIIGVDNSGTNPANDPYSVQEQNYPVTNGQITVPIHNLKALSAYQIIVSPNTNSQTINNSSNRYEAEYAKLNGTAKVTYGSNTGYSGTYFVEGYGNTNNASTEFIVSAPTNGYYNLNLRYSAGPFSNAPTTRQLKLVLNGSDLTTVNLDSTANWNTWNTKTTSVFLNAGINRISYNAFTTDESDAVNLDYLEISPNTTAINSYEAESNSNVLGGTAIVTDDAAASGGKYVGYIGNGASNTLQFNDITAPKAGKYRMVVTFANAEVKGEHSYNNNVVERVATITVNGDQAQSPNFFNTRQWNNYKTMVFDVNLKAGTNTIKFTNASAYAPNIDRIQIAMPIINNTGNSIANNDSVIADVYSSNQS